MVMNHQLCLRNNIGDWNVNLIHWNFIKFFWWYDWHCWSYPKTVEFEASFFILPSPWCHIRLILDTVTTEPPSVTGKVADGGILDYIIFYVASQVAQWVKNLPAMQETQVRSLGREEPGGEYGNPLQYSCLGNLMDRGTWQVTVNRLAKRHDWAQTPTMK